MRLAHWAAWGVKGKGLLAFVQIRVQDNVNAQHQLVTEKFGITSLVAVLGWSMGAGQTFQWAVRSAQLPSALFYQALPSAYSALASQYGESSVTGRHAVWRCPSDRKLLHCSYPEMVPKILPFCGSARTSPHNKVCLLAKSQGLCYH